MSCVGRVRWAVLLAGSVWLAGCASDEPAAPEPDTRARMDQILSPMGGKPNTAYTKRSRYDGQDFRSKSMNKRSLAGAGRDGRAREGDKGYTQTGGLKARWSGQASRFQEADAREGGRKARTFASRHDDQEARTKAFRGANDRYRTGEAREADDAFYTGQPRGYSTRTLAGTQLSRSALDTANANLFSTDPSASLNEEDVRRVLNKPSRKP